VPGPGLLWLLDGNNLVGCVPDGWWRDRQGAALRLAQQARAWIEGQDEGERALLVFDGRPVAAIQALAGGRLEVGFATRSGPDAADDVLVARAWEEVALGREVIVVSSDRGLRARLPAGVQVQGARSWRSGGAGSTV